MSLYLNNISYIKLLDIIKEAQKTTMYFKRIKETNDNIMVSCPYHKNGQEANPSCGIHIKNLSYHCFTCGASGNFIDLMQDIKVPFDMSRVRSSRDEISIKIGNNNKVINNEITHPEYTVGLTRYLQKRGLTHEICDMYLIGYTKDSVIFPVRNLQGRVIYYVERKVQEKNYMLSVANKPIYGLYEFYKYAKDKSYCFIVESTFNLCSLIAWGYNAISLLGTGSNEQIEKLKKSSIRLFILCMDGDEAGKKATERIRKKLVNKIVLVVRMYDNKDVNDLSQEQFNKLLEENKISI